MKKFISGFMVLFLTMLISLSAYAAPGDLFVQFDLEDGTDQCSIMKVMPDGTFSEFVSFTSIIALTGLPECDMDDTGLTVADNGDVYFSEDESDSIIKATPAERSALSYPRLKLQPPQVRVVLTPIMEWL